MDLAVPPPGPPAATIDDVIARMKAIDAALPAGDGVACFNRMYLEVTVGVGGQVEQGLFGDPAWVTALDVGFANLYFAAIDSLSGPPSSQPTAWRPLLSARGEPDIEPIQFALAGMNVHINHDLPLAVVATCTDLDTTPTDGSHREDYQKIDKLLDASEQSVREAFEPSDVRGADRHVANVTNLVCNWSLNEARDVAWDTALAIWTVRDHHLTSQLLTNALARVVAMGTSTLLVAV
ncbi:MAG: DUF5995 family protein [Jatrophihabitantaceae bacterium]